MKFKEKIKNCQLSVKVKTSSRETIGFRELDRFSRIYLRGFLKPQVLKKNTVVFTGPIGISLEKKLRMPVSKRVFLMIMEQIVIAVRKLEKNCLSLGNLIMDIRHTYINETTSEVQLLYLPAVGVQNHTSLIGFIESIIYSTIPTCQRDAEFLARFIYFIQAMKPFSINTIEKYIAAEDRSVVLALSKLNDGQSGYMTDKHQSYYNHYNPQQSSKASAQNDDDDTTLLQSDDDDTTLLQSDNDDTTLLQSDDDDTTLLQNDDDDTTLLQNDDDDTTLLQSDDDDTTLLQNDDDDTTLLQDDVEGTVLLNNNTPEVHFATLYRVRTEETISINKPVFRVGEEKSYVDYFVTNNPAVSRSHADIITRGDQYFIMDLNSTNHTFVNNVKIPIMYEVELHSGDHVLLGNEEFIFSE